MELFIAAWGDGSWEDRSDPRQPHEANLLRLCIDKSIHQLGCGPRWRVFEAIQATAQWYRRFYREHSENMVEACHADLDRYESSPSGEG